MARDAFASGYASTALRQGSMFSLKMRITSNSVPMLDSCSPRIASMLPTLPAAPAIP